MTNYETELRKKFAERYPNPTPEQSARIERKIGELLAKQRQAPPAKARQLEQRIDQVVAQYHARLAAQALSVTTSPQTRTQTHDKEITRER